MVEPHQRSGEMMCVGENMNGENVYTGSDPHL